MDDKANSLSGYNYASTKQYMILYFCLTCRDLYSREKLDEYLSRALNVPLTNGRLAPIDEQNYVLTLDFTLKMLNIHERYQCGVPAIIEGETGVGKTALIEMLSKLWNHSLVAQWEIEKDRILDVIKRKLGGKYNHSFILNQLMQLYFVFFLT